MDSNFVFHGEPHLKGFDLKLCGSLWDALVILLFTSCVLLRIRACDAHNKVVSVPVCTSFYPATVAYVLISL